MKKYQTNIVRFTDNSEETKRVLADIKKYRPLSQEEEFKCAWRARELNDEASRHKLVKHNLLFVVSVAKTYLQPTFSLNELCSAGFSGLCKAADRFDERKGLRFITYAVSWVQKEIVEYLDQRAHAVHLPDSHQKKMAKLRKAVTKFEHEFLRQPSDEEIADMMGIDAEVIKELRRLNASVFSCDEHVAADDNESVTFADTMAADVPATDLMAQHHVDEEVIRHEIWRTIKNPDDLEVFFVMCEGSTVKINALIEKRKTTEAYLKKVYNVVKSQLSKNPTLRDYYYA